MSERLTNPSPDITAIYSADWHLTDRAADEYRWDVFPWLCDLIKRERARYLFFLGDLTEEKDEHSGVLVNRVIVALKTVVSALNAASDNNGRIYILAGNHDGLSAKRPFFKFLHRSIKGRIFHVSRPAEIGLWKQRYLFLPHTRNWADYARYDFREFDRVLIHQSVAGALTEAGQRLEDGLRLSDLAGCRRVIAGDIHRPQTMKNLTYTGSPFPIRFGDDFQPRVLVETNGVFKSVARETIQKAVLRYSGYLPPDTTALAKLRRDDRVKIEVTVPRAEFGGWRAYEKTVSRYTEKNGVHLAGMKLVEARIRRRLNSGGATPRILTKAPAAVLGAYITERGVAAGLVPYAEEILNGV